MACKDFEVQLLFKVYRKGLISEELFLEEMGELCAPQAGSAPTEGTDNGAR
jgi:hypothetical protein